MALGWVPKSVGRGLRGLGRARGRQAMLLVEQGVLWVLPMLWLVLLLSEAGAVLETGCSLEMGPGSHRPPRGTPRGNQTQGEQRWPWLGPLAPSNPHKPSQITPQLVPGMEMSRREGRWQRGPQTSRRDPEEL